MGQTEAQRATPTPVAPHIPAPAPVRVPRTTVRLTPVPAAVDVTEPARLTFRQAVGRVLRVERRSQSRTLQDVAEAAQVSLAFLSEIERGRKQPSSEVLAALSRALHLEVADVVARSADELRAAAAGGPQLRAA